MQSIKISSFGIYSTKEHCSNVKISPVRRVRDFEFDFIISCSEGSASIIDEKEVKLCPNMLIVRKPGQNSNSRLHFKCYCLHLQIPTSHFLYNDLVNTPNFFTLINATAYQSVFESLTEYLVKQSTVETDYFILSKIFGLVDKIKKDSPQNSAVSHRNIYKKHFSVQKAKEYIKSNYFKEITLEDLGSLTGYSPNHFAKLFTAQMGISPRQYIEKIRVNQAKILLMKNDKSILDISLNCGFSSQPHFSKVFKTHTLLTPYEFQQKFRFLK